METSHHFTRNPSKALMLTNYIFLAVALVRRVGDLDGLLFNVCHLEG